MTDEELQRKILDAIIADPSISEEYREKLRRERERGYLDKAHRVSKVPKHGSAICD